MNGSESPHPRGRNRRKKYRKKKKNEFEPITSYGLIVYTLHKDQVFFLLYQRRDNFEYMDFLRGVWPTYETLPALFSAMSVDERVRIRNFTFPELWEDLWVEHQSRIFIDGFAKAKRKYDMAKYRIPFLLENTTSSILEPPWGFPKGKKNNFREGSLTCAFREFQEETRLPSEQIQVLRDQQPYIETFRGSNGKIYSTYYYLASFPSMILPPKIETPHCIRDHTISEEASNVQWFSYEDACGLLSAKRCEFLRNAMDLILESEDVS